MTVALILERTTAGLPLAEWPSLYVVAPTQGRYTHLARSAFRFEENRQRGWRHHVHTWCGRSIRDPRTVDTPEDEFPVCGTCHGRYAAQHTDTLAFRPELGVASWGRVKRWCPGSRPGMLHHHLGDSHATCVLCGENGRIAVYGWNGRPHVARHEFGTPEPVVYCPQHGIGRLAVVGCTVVCHAWLCTFTLDICSR